MKCPSSKEDSGDDLIFIFYLAIQFVKSSGRTEKSVAYTCG